jgi:hypothetical protein
MVEKNIGKPSGGPWYACFKTRYVFERDAFDQYPSLVATNVRKGKKLWRQYSVNIPLKDYDQTRAVIIKSFPGKGSPPEATTDGPKDSPHRYNKGQLCMWYPWTRKSERWVFEDGLLHLLVLIEAHLFREAWWRETGEWLGPERPHDEI